MRGFTFISMIFSRLPVRRAVRFAWVCLFWAASLACAFGQTTAEPTSTSYPSLNNDCTQNTAPSDQDIQDALGFTGEVFSDSAWVRTYTVLSDRVTVTWTNDSAGALGYLENIVYSCGYTQADVDAFFSEQSLKDVILQNYENPDLKSRCSINLQKLDLYEMTASFNQVDYLVRIWVTQVNPTRLVYIFLTYPESGADSLEQVAQNLYPELPKCLR